MKRERRRLRHKPEPEVTVLVKAEHETPFVPRSGAWLYSYRDILTSRAPSQGNLVPPVQWTWK